MKVPRFKINDVVYHITPESPKGVVLDVKYSYLTKRHTYEVTFSAEVASMEYQEHELSENKQFS
jgi:hypothetical protein